MHARTHRILILLTVVLLFAGLVALTEGAPPGRKRYLREPVERGLPGWKTNTAKRLIRLHELEQGGPGKDGIPAIDRPVFVSLKSARSWLSLAEPVISLVIDGQARAYPLQILIWHEMVNDRIAGVPVAVTFCPLCYSAIAFDRRVSGHEYTFGVSGMLRNSNMVMYDHQTESLWQQLTGEAVVGDLVGNTLRQIPAQIVSFGQFVSAHKTGLVLSRNTGYKRDYGRNPYVGYDNISNRPFMYRGKSDGRLKPMEKVVTVSINNVSKAYPYSITQKKRVINDEVGGEQIVVFHHRGAISALDRADMPKSRQVGSTGVFHREVHGRLLTFAYNYANFTFVDDQTASMWDITGQAIEGPLKGRNLSPVAHGDYFAFAWLVFKPETAIYR